MLVNAENVKNLTKGVVKIFNDSFKDTPKDYEKYATVVPTKHHTVDYAWLANFPAMKEWVNDRDLKDLTAHKYTISKKDWEASVTVSRDDVLFDNLGFVKPRVTDLAHVAVEHYNSYIGSLITTNGLCFDGKNYFDTKHKIGAATAVNKNNFKFTSSNLMSVYSEMLNRKNENGKPYRIKPTLVYIAANLLADAMKILKSDQIDGSTNTTKDLVEYVVLPELAVGTWCMVDNSRPLKPFIIQITKKAEIESDDSEMFKSKKIHYGVDTMDNAGYSFWQLAYFSDGTQKKA
ncbi:Mu-like prophage major head subunit gpT family protein [Sulfurimonas sp.]|uniref:Mu-like prophage major head subunit gpT family protein n=1 Tax=Sulfurimonas sp. TaxID=2022749 RepID=UPI002B4779C5|nr:Mu-like prophage major head subunit gpT family protein [Sulfurimonas sp.]